MVMNEEQLVEGYCTAIVTAVSAGLALLYRYSDNLP